MLATIRDDTWNVQNMLHIIINLKRWNIQTSPMVAIDRLKGPAHMVEGGHHLRKAPNPDPPLGIWILKYIKVVLKQEFIPHLFI